MESLRSVIVNVEQGDFFTTIDLKDAYLHVPIHVDSQQYLRFTVQGFHYKFQALIFLGVKYDSRQHKVFLTTQKHLKLQAAARHAISLRLISARDCMRLLGLMTSAIEVVPFAQAHLRNLQLNFLQKWRGDYNNLDYSIFFSGATKTYLQWWIQRDNIMKAGTNHLRRQSHRLGRRIRPQVCTRSVVTDTNLTSHKYARATGDLLSAKILVRSTKRIPIKVRSDNATVVAYINHQGGTHSRAAWKEVYHILLWAENNSCRLAVIYIPGQLNWEANFLSRVNTTQGSVSTAYNQVGDPTDRPDGQQVLSPNTGLLFQISRPRSMSVDAMTTAWDFQPVYIFPPIPMIHPVPRRLSVSNDSDSNSTLLAQESMVFRSKETINRSPVATSSKARLASAGPLLAPIIGEIIPDGLAIESSIWKNKGFSDQVTTTMLRARKPTTSSTYRHIWSC
ncbi:uncharacterized protein LOC108699997 [Xenopus laevis]|uniref:Uncharacterized protein LOC108699997 n=1 Tax=Xenopus laevis TaxID=8355 RepID=A0A8J1LMV4_XENLA|nr:uncharacterized protein LOC108699997 [Xenopus laevis]